MTATRRWYQFGFSIRDLLLFTVIAALAVGWWVDRRGLASRAQEAESFQALSEVLAGQLQNKNPAASIEITVNGRGSVISTGWGTSPKSATAGTPKTQSGKNPAPPRTTPKGSGTVWRCCLILRRLLGGCLRSGQSQDEL